MLIVQGVRPLVGVKQ